MMGMPQSFLKRGLYALLFLLAGSSVYPLVASAADTPDPKAGPTTEGKAVLVADINFAGATATYATSTRTVTVQASIKNTLGDISGATFGLELQGKNVNDAVYSTDSITLGKNGTAMQTLDMQIPLDVSGSVMILGVIRSSGGSILATTPVWLGSVASGVVSSPLTCTTKGVLISCAVAKGTYTLHYTVYKNAVGGTVVASENKEGVGGKTVALPESALSAGRYAVVVHLTGTGGVISSRTYSFMVDGTYGSISIAVAEAQADGEYKVITTSEAFATTPTDFSLSFTGMKGGAACGAPLTVPSTASVAETVFTPRCSIDEIGIALVAGSTTLDSVVTHVSPYVSSGTPSMMWWFVGLLAIIILGVIGLLILKKKQTPPPSTIPPTYA